MGKIRDIKRWALQHVEIINECHYQMSQEKITSEEMDELSERIYLNFSIIVRMFGSYYAPMMAYFRKHELEDMDEIYDFVRS